MNKGRKPGICLIFYCFGRTEYAIGNILILITFGSVVKVIGISLLPGQLVVGNSYLGAMIYFLE